MLQVAALRDNVAAAVSPGRRKSGRVMFRHGEKRRPACRPSAGQISRQEAQRTSRPDSEPPISLAEHEQMSSGSLRKDAPAGSRRRSSLMSMLVPGGRRFSQEPDERTSVAVRTAGLLRAAASRRPSTEAMLGGLAVSVSSMRERSASNLRQRSESSATMRQVSSPLGPDKTRGTSAHLLTRAYVRTGVDQRAIWRARARLQSATATGRFVRADDG